MKIANKKYLKDLLTNFANKLSPTGKYQLTSTYKIPILLVLLKEKVLNNGLLKV